ncbi:MAG: DUF47 family protein [Clostridia bacterium]|nr:DUF47 family protein [Clostridia bacterium]
MKKDQYYFDVLIRSAAYGCDAAMFLQESFLQFEPETVTQRMEAIHVIEHNADSLKHEMMRKLGREFMTPVEREDILTLSQELDNVVDCLDDVMQRIYIHNVLALRGDMLDFIELIVRCTKALHRALEEFPHFKRSQTIAEHIVEVNSLESEGDVLYMKAMRRMNTTETDPINILAWTHIYEGLENCMDACEHASDIIESVIMKNT